MIFVSFLQSIVVDFRKHNRTPSRMIKKKRPGPQRPGHIGSSSLGYTAGFGTLHCCRLPDFTGPVPPSLLISWYSICATVILLIPVENVNTSAEFSMICLSFGQTKSSALAELLSLILLFLSGGVEQVPTGSYSLEH